MEDLTSTDNFQRIGLVWVETERGGGDRNFNKNGEDSMKILSDQVRFRWI